MRSGLFVPIFDALVTPRSSPGCPPRQRKPAAAVLPARVCAGVEPRCVGGKHVKHDRIGRAGVSSPEDLKAKALAALHRLQKLPQLLQGFFGDPNLRYITA
jgi:hypothetical protein